MAMGLQRGHPARNVAPMWRAPPVKITSDAYWTLKLLKTLYGPGGSESPGAVSVDVLSPTISCTSIDQQLPTNVLAA